jgi:hypothetical protein
LVEHKHDGDKADSSYLRAWWVWQGTENMDLEKMTWLPWKHRKRMGMKTHIETKRKSFKGIAHSVHGLFWASTFGEGSSVSLYYKFITRKQLSIIHHGFKSDDLFITLSHMQRRLPSPGFQVEVVILGHDAPISAKVSEGAAAQSATSESETPAPSFSEREASQEGAGLSTLAPNAAGSRNAGVDNTSPGIWQLPPCHRVSQL